MQHEVACVSSALSAGHRYGVAGCLFVFVVTRGFLTCSPTSAEGGARDTGEDGFVASESDSCAVTTRVRRI